MTARPAKREAPPFAALGLLLKERRKARGLSLQNLADATGVSRRQIATMETGANTSLGYLALIVRALQIDELPLAGTIVRVTSADASKLKEAIEAARETASRAASLLSSVVINDFSAPVVPMRVKGDRVADRPMRDVFDHVDSPLRPVNLEFEEEIEVTIIGYVAAGLPIDSLNEGHGETMRVPLSEAPDPKWVALKARGDSMIEFGIYDGDLVYVEPRRGLVAATGEIVIGWLNDGLVIKEWYWKRGVKKLISWNREYPDRVLTEEDTWELQAIVRKHVPRAIRGRLFMPKEVPKISG